MSLSSLFRPFDWNVLDSVERDFERFFRDFGPARRAGAPPSLSVWHGKESSLVELEIPGVDPKDIDVSLENRTLTIRGKRTVTLGEGVSAIRQEREQGEFTRTVVLPNLIDASKVEARCENGILTVTLPYAAESLPRKIEVS